RPAHRAEVAARPLDGMSEGETAFLVRGAEHALQRDDPTTDVLEKDLGELEGHRRAGLTSEIFDAGRIEAIGVLDRSARIEARNGRRPLGLSRPGDPI